MPTWKSGVLPAHLPLQPLILLLVTADPHTLMGRLVPATRTQLPTIPVDNTSCRYKSFKTGGSIEISLSVRLLLLTVVPCKCKAIEDMDPLQTQSLNESSFVPIVTADIKGRFPTVAYRSAKTGMTVAIVQCDGPLVSGYLTLATETHDDDGLPHTLEHLVFMGSESYPWQGILDEMANRCYASGTGAYTCVDHTSYTLHTAGVGGFLRLLPIYLDHILFPTLSDSAFLTEIHHITGEGEDAGVVYSEMQGKENRFTKVVQRELMTALYPGKCGHNSVTGGKLVNLRESTTNEKVRDYHQRFYRPGNLWVIVIGQVDPKRVFASLEPVEEKILAKGVPQEPSIRPWTTPCDPLKETVHKEAYYPVDTESYGSIVIAWRGLPAITDEITMTALWVLFEYLASSPVCPLNKVFVEIKNPLASEVAFTLLEYVDPAVVVQFDNVPLESMAVIPESFWNNIREIQQGTLCMDRIRNILHSKIVNVKNILESEPHETLSKDVIHFMLFGRTPEDLHRRLNTELCLEELKLEDHSYWMRLLHEYFDEGRPHVILNVRPSVELKERHAEEEKRRFQERRATLGVAGLAEKKWILDKAIEGNKTRPQPEVLESISPQLCSNEIKFHSLDSFANFPLPSTNGTCVVAQTKYFALSELPMKMRLDHVQSNFTAIYFILDTESLPLEQRLLLPLFLEAIVESPLQYPPGMRWAGQASCTGSTSIDKHGCQDVPLDVVVAQKEADVQTMTAYLGVGGGDVFTVGFYCSYAVIKIRVEATKYLDGIRWLRDTIGFTKIDPERVQIVAAKMLQTVGEHKNDPGIMLPALMTHMDYAEGSNHWAVNLIRQKKLLSGISHRLQSLLPERPAEAYRDPAIQSLRLVQDFFIRNTTRALFHVVTDVELVHKHLGGITLEQPWLEHFVPYFAHEDDWDRNVNEPFEAVSDVPFLVPGGYHGAKSSCILGLGSVDSSDLRQTIRTGIHSGDHSDYPALLLLLEYLDQTEGPLWKALRGAGLSYNFYLSAHFEEGLLEFHLGSCPKVDDAYDAALRVVRLHLAPDFVFDPIQLESAKSSLIFQLIKAEETVRYQEHESVLSLFRGVPVDHAKTIITKVQGVTQEEMKASAARYLAPLFDVEFSRLAVICPSRKVENLVASFGKRFGRPLHPIEDIEKWFLEDFEWLAKNGTS